MYDCGPFFASYFDTNSWSYFMLQQCHNLTCLRLIYVIFIASHTIVAGYYGFTLDVRVSVCPSVICPSIRFSFPDDNLSKHQWIYTKFGMCTDLVEIWFCIANGQILTKLSARDTPIFSFTDDYLNKRQWIFTKLGMCIDIEKIWIGIANRQI